MYDRKREDKNNPFRPLGLDKGFESSAESRSISDLKIEISCLEKQISDLKIEIDHKDRSIGGLRKEVEGLTGVLMGVLACKSETTAQREERIRENAETVDELKKTNEKLYQMSEHLNSQIRKLSVMPTRREFDKPDPEIGNA